MLSQATPKLTKVSTSLACFLLPTNRPSPTSQLGMFHHFSAKKLRNVGVGVMIYYTILYYIILYYTILYPMISKESGAFFRCFFPPGTPSFSPSPPVKGRCHRHLQGWVAPPIGGASATSFPCRPSNLGRDQKLPSGYLT